MSRTVAIIQCRTGSTRLPEKALRPLEGTPMIEHIIKRVRAAGVFEEVLLAIPDTPSEEKLVSLAHRLAVPCVKGPEEDVLQRFILAAESVEADQILRVCGDNPLIDLEIMKELVKEHQSTGSDYTIPADAIPLGTGSEMVRLQALKIIAGKTRDPRFREHVTTWFQDHPDDFRIARIPAPWYLRNIHLRLTVDTEKDFELIALLYGKFCRSPEFMVDLEEAVHFLARHPDIARHNADVIQKNWRTQ